ncbi:unnamed protein product [Coffea canephora]|uniref:Uncharacterized protein n=1 Tax=Coffea canephora TaxID=49390 RepID=A0A068V2E7_COFCA|nr:unnamed protein product [Coffea canephora]
MLTSRVLIYLIFSFKIVLEFLKYFTLFSERKQKQTSQNEEISLGIPIHFHVSALESDIADIFGDFKLQHKSLKEKVKDCNKKEPPYKEEKE